MTQNQFGYKIELNKFLGSIDLIQDAYHTILKTPSTYRLHTSPSGIKVLAFNCSPDYTTRFLKGEFGLVSSENHKVVDFISTKVNPRFAINKAAVDLFENVFVELLQLEDQLIDSPLVVTGRSLAGYLAILFTLWLQHSVRRIKRPICITYGSPLVGDESLQRALGERQWKSCFLNVVSKTDPVPSFFTSNSAYKPFGTYIFCTESGGHMTFEEEDSVLAVLDVTASSSSKNMEMHNYENVLKSIRRKVLYRGGSELSKLDFKSQREINTLHTKTLTDMRIGLTYMELYMRTNISKEGYYICYKNTESKEDIVEHKCLLDRYWKKVVEEKDKMPQKEGFELRYRWLYMGTHYRRIVEPLEIADYYKMGKKNYIANRPNHHIMLENWLDEAQNNLIPSTAQRRKTSILTSDSCFWAYVEEALISLEELEGGGSSHSATDITQGVEMFRANLQCALAVVRSRWIDE